MQEPNVGIGCEHEWQQGSTEIQLKPHDSNMSLDSCREFAKKSIASAMDLGDEQMLISAHYQWLLNECSHQNPAPYIAEIRQSSNDCLHEVRSQRRVANAHDNLLAACRAMYEFLAQPAPCQIVIDDSVRRLHVMRLEAAIAKASVVK